VNAEGWFARLHSPDCMPSEREAFARWMVDPANASAYEACQTISALSSDLRAHRALVDDLLQDAGVSHSEKATSPLARNWTPAMALAATVAALAIGLNAVFTPNRPLPLTATTERGQQREVMLADGSRIQLNTDTILDWRMTTNERWVHLKRGEAYFDVARDTKRPFVVRAGSSEVRVLGTQFSVREENGRLQVIVRQGKVDVVPDSSRIADVTPTKVELTPGKHLSYNDTDNVVRIAVVDPERSLAWRSGTLDFDAVTLDEAVSEINRYVSRPLVVIDSRLSGLRLSGRFNVGDSAAFLFTLRERFGILATFDRDTVSLHL
jgi:transmembrane sensor